QVCLLRCAGHFLPSLVLLRPAFQPGMHRLFFFRRAVPGEVFIQQPADLLLLHWRTLHLYCRMKKYRGTINAEKKIQKRKNSIFFRENRNCFNTVVSWFFTVWEDILRVLAISLMLMCCWRLSR